MKPTRTTDTTPATQPEGLPRAASHSVPADSPRLPDGSVIDRRTMPDRRTPVAIRDAGALHIVTPADDTGLERRRGPGRRLSDFTRSAEEGELTKEQFLFLMAVEAFKKANGKSFPSWTDVLEVVRLLGYRKTCRSELNLRAAEDWLESPTAESNVRPARWHERAA